MRFLGLGCLLSELLLFCVTTAEFTKSRAATRPDVDSRTILGITLGHATLAEVTAKLGAATLWGDGDASTAEMKVCYVTQEPNPVVIMFASNAEMAGPPENQVTDIRIVKVAAYKQRSNCRSLTIHGDEVSAASGLTLGLTTQRVRNILGPPRSISGSSWDYSWSVDESLPASDKNYQRWMVRRDECFEGKKPFFTVSSEIVVQFGGGKVISLSLRRIESIC
jgi:hypothetical protein